MFKHAVIEVCVLITYPAMKKAMILKEERGRDLNDSDAALAAVLRGDDLTQTQTSLLPLEAKMKTLAASFFFQLPFHLKFLLSCFLMHS